jgi:protoheme IX farnesyltransferase
MPILAGRALALGHIDWIGILLALVILLWIPSHILTLAMNHSKDYKLAGVPTFPNVFGFMNARYFMAASNLAAAGIMLAVSIWLGVSISGIVVLSLGSLILLGFSVRNIMHSSERLNFAMFKYVSLYMAVAMLILIL